MQLAAYVLHSRPYKESSALVDFFTAQGRIRAVLRAARGKVGSIARPFAPLELELRGRGELKTVGGRVEAAFSGWSRTARMTFPGERSNWIANRAVHARPTWRLVQDSVIGASPIRLGVVGGMDRADAVAAVPR